MTGAPTLYDIQGVQSRAHAERGIARYLLECASALERWHPGIVGRYLLNPDLEVPGSLEPLTSSGRLEFSDRFEVGGASVYHVGSPVELEVPMRKLWPRSAQLAGLRLVTTLYDLIPRLFSKSYLTDPLVQRRYETRLELIRRADRILAISKATARDAVDHLGVRPERVTIVGTGVSHHFQPTADRHVPLAVVRTTLPPVQPGFVLYTGGIEPRKNIDGLLKAYAAMPRELRSAHQLVVVCRVLAAEREVLDRKLEGLAIADRVVFTGFVADDVLVSLYQAADLFVFPSLYEGFGLPVAEAIACGTPVAFSRLPVLGELLDEPAAQFDPHDPRSIADVLARCLSDADLQARLRAAKLPRWATWRSVADRTVEAYEAVAAVGRRPRRLRSRPRVAFVSPLPPQRSGVADDSYRLIAALANHVEIDAFADGETQKGHAPPGVRVLGASNFHAAEAIACEYDKVFYCLGNS
jgi:glycosyltransferase involved in cell wall biosynthesis